MIAVIRTHHGPSELGHELFERLPGDDPRQHADLCDPLVLELRDPAEADRSIPRHRKVRQQVVGDVRCRPQHALGMHPVGHGRELFAEPLRQNDTEIVEHGERRHQHADDDRADGVPGARAVGRERGVQPQHRLKPLEAASAAGRPRADVARRVRIRRRRRQARR